MSECTTVSLNSSLLQDFLSFLTNSQQLLLALPQPLVFVDMLPRLVDLEFRKNAQAIEEKHSGSTCNSISGRERFDLHSPMCVPVRTSGTATCCWQDTTTQASAL